MWSVTGILKGYDQVFMPTCMIFGVSRIHKTCRRFQWPNLPPFSHQLVNIVLDDTTENLRGNLPFIFRWCLLAFTITCYGLVITSIQEARHHIQKACMSPSDPSDPYKITDKTRKLGLTVCRGTSVMVPTTCFPQSLVTFVASSSYHTSPIFRTISIIMFLLSARLPCGWHHRN